MSVQDKQTNLTAEEAIKILQEDSCFHCWYETMNYTQCRSKSYCKVRAAMNIAVEALKRGDVLDKIRAEIEKIIQEETVIDSSGGEYERTISKLDPDDVFEIIDKYRAESEDDDACSN